MTKLPLGVCDDSGADDSGVSGSPPAPVAEVVAGANESLVLPPPPKLNEEVVPLALLAADARGLGPLTVSGLLSAPASDDGELLNAKAGLLC